MITLTRENTKENQEIPFTHSNRYPYVKEETWHIIISINDDIYYYMKLSGSSKVQETSWKFFPKQVFGDRTEINMTLSVLSDSYRGLD